MITPLQLGKLCNYQITPHLIYLQQKVLETIAKPGKQRLIVQLPVRHGKSWLVSKIIPAWFLMSFPDKQVILSGYGSDFASEWGRQARDIFGKFASPLFGLSLNNRQSRADHWAIANHEGGMRTCGTLGSISGKGAHLLISDDQIKDQAQANSPVYRDNVFNWFMADCLTRLEPDGKVIVVLSRRHPDDLVGRLTSNSSDWQVIRMAALCDDPENDPLGRQLDEPLWKERYSKDSLLKIKDELEISGQSHIWECLYQQNPLGDPSSREWPMDYFDDIWCDQLPTSNVRLRVLSLDPSKSKKSHTGDYSAFVYVVLTNDGKLWVQSWAYREPLDRLVATSLKLLDELRPDGFIYESVLMQALLGHTIREECSRKNIPCPIWEYNSMEDKIVRIRMALTPLLGQKRIKLDKGCLGNRLLLSQMKTFPTGNHDDLPDSLTMSTYLINQMLHGRKSGQNIILRV